MTHAATIRLSLLLAAWLGFAVPITMAQPSALSGAEGRFVRIHADMGRYSERFLRENPSFAHWQTRSDSIPARAGGMVYSGWSTSGTEGDFLPYEGRDASDGRIGAVGMLPSSTAGTLSGRIRYGRGMHRGIGWSATRQSEYYRPYFSTDSIGGDYTFDSYMAEGGYGFAAGARWTLGLRVAFQGEQAWRLTDPRALNNTTWLQFATGAAWSRDGHLLLLGAGYARNKQRVQLRYWRPGQQDRFFVCYGFGFYDTRQSGVSFGKSRMYYIDRLDGQLQYRSPQGEPWMLHAAVKYAFFRMRTEERDIYNLYESRTHLLSPLFRLTWAPDGPWRLHFNLTGEWLLRRGLENIIEEYLIDPENNIYDFRTIDTQQNYGFSEHHLTGTLEAEWNSGHVGMFLQAGLSSEGYRETYKPEGHRIHIWSLMPHAKSGIRVEKRNDSVELALLYGRKMVVSHDYDVVFNSQNIPHLDFQHAFAPYAYHAGELNHVTASATWLHKLGRYTIGLSGELLLTEGKRLPEVAFTGPVGFASSAPMISPSPDLHIERRGALKLFLIF